MQKQKTTPLADVPEHGVRSEFFKLDKNSLEQAYIKAFNDSDWEAEAELHYEMARRHANKANKKAGLPKIPVTIKEVKTAISSEISAFRGIPSEDGIPPLAPASIKRMLERITHRDAEVQTAARMMLYRMANLGKKHLST